MAVVVTIQRLVNVATLVILIQIIFLELFAIIVTIVITGRKAVIMQTILVTTTILIMYHSNNKDVGCR